MLEKLKALAAALAAHVNWKELAIKIMDILWSSLNFLSDKPVAEMQIKGDRDKAVKKHLDEAIEALEGGKAAFDFSGLLTLLVTLLGQIMSRRGGK